MFVTLSGIATLTRLEHPSNSDPPMLEMPLPIVTLMIGQL
jgi:hypothetical protein